MTGAALFFWMVAGLQVILAASIHVRAVQTQFGQNFALARSQRKDGWLACIVMTVMLVSDNYPFTGWIYLHIKRSIASLLGDASGFGAWMSLLSTIVMGWLVHRALERRRVLQLK